MKTLQQFVCVLVLLGTITTSFAQNLGAIQRGQRGYTPPPRDIAAGEPEKPDVNVIAQEKATLYAEILQIDAFKKEVLKSYLRDFYVEKIDITYNPDLKFDEKQPLMITANNKFEKRLTEILDADQIETLLATEQMGMRPKEEKKKKKNKKKKKKRNRT